MTRRTLSIPVFILSLLASASAVAGVWLVREWQLGRLSNTLLVHARKEEGDKNWLEAAEHLDRYLRIQPRNKSVRVQLAMDYAKGATTLEEKRRAVALHYRALASELGEEAGELRVSLAELLLETGRLLEAEGEAEDVLAADKNNGRALRVYALARYFQWIRGALATKRHDELKLLASVESALAKNPADIALAEVAAQLYREFPDVVAARRVGLNQLSREQVADSWIDKAIKNNPNNAKAFLARHKYRSEYQLPGEWEDLDRALQLGPSDAQVLMVGGEAYFQEGRRLLADESAEAEARFAKATQLFQRLIDKDLAREDPHPHLRLGDILVLQGKLDPALAAWREALAAYEAPLVHATFQARIADCLLKAGRVKEVEKPLEAIDTALADLGGTISRQEYLKLMQSQGLRRATYDLIHGRYSAAIGQLQQAIARQPQPLANPETAHRAWDLLGRAYAGLEDWTAAATFFDRASNFQPTEVSSRLEAARSWLTAGRADLAIDRAEQVIDLQGPPEAWIVLATAELQVQALLPQAERNWDRLQTALRGLDQLEATDGIDSPWRIDFIKADFVALRAAPSDDPAHGRIAATEVLHQAELKHDERPNFWFEVCMAYERLGQKQDAQRAWERLNQLPGARTEAAIAAARRAAMHDDFVQANRILEESSYRATGTGQSRIRQEQLRLAQVRQDFAQMKKLLAAELVERPDDVGVLCKLAELSLREDDITAVEQFEDKLAAIGPHGELWARYFRVLRLYKSATDKDDPVLRQALSEQAQLATLRPNWAESFALRGAIEQKMERTTAAIEAYEEAIALGERRYAVFEQLITCLEKAGREADIDKYLARLESYLPSSQRLTEIAVHRRLDSDRPEQAIELARRAVAQRPNDAGDLLWLGRLLMLTGKMAEAHETFQKATEIAPHEVRTWNGMFSYYLRSGEKQRASQVLESIAAQTAIDRHQREIAIGTGYLRLGETEKALEVLTDLAGQELPDMTQAKVQLQLAMIYLESDRERAKQHLQKAVALNPAENQSKWLLASILAAGGSEEELAQAEELLGGAAGASSTIEDRRVRALLLAQHGAEDGLERAIRILEQIIADGSETPNDRLLLAQFYERQFAGATDPDVAKDRLKAARDQLVALATRSRAQAADVAALVDFLLRHNESADAGVWLDRLEERVRTRSLDDPRAIARLIELRIKHGSTDRCEAWIDRLEEVDHDPVRPLLARATFLSALGRANEIEPAVEKKAQALIEAAVDRPDRSRIARAVGDLYLNVHQPAAAERWYRIVVKEDREQFPLLALALMRQGRAADAVKVCQTAIEFDKTSRPAVVLTSILLETGAKPEHVALAEGVLTVALERFPEDPDLLYGVGMLRIFQDRYPEATDLLSKVIKLNPRHVAALNNLSVLLAETPDRRDKAMELVQRAIEIRGQEPTLLDTHGTILLLGGQSREAVSLLEAAARGMSTDPRHKFHLAIAYLDIGSEDQAKQQFALSLEQDLEKQILTPTDRKSVERLKSTLKVASL